MGVGAVVVGAPAVARSFALGYWVVGWGWWLGTVHEQERG